MGSSDIELALQLDAAINKRVRDSDLVVSLRGFRTQQGEPFRKAVTGCCKARS
jgi:hypothetical protein